MNIRSLLRIVPALVAAAVLAACTPPTQVPSPGTIAEIAAADADFSTLVAALTEAGLVDTLAGPGPFTVFAPTNAAFAEFLDDADLTAQELLASPALGDILRYHVVPGTFLAADVIDAAPFDAPTLLEGETIDVAVVEGGVVLNGTVNVVATDIVASNGVIHVIDYVLTPAEEEVLPTIAEIAAGDENFSILVAALAEADLVATFADPEAGPFTVFAPTNAAFEALLELLETDIEGLLARQDLGDILAYHVVPGAVLAADVVAAAPFDADTLLTGATIAVAVEGDGVVLNGAINVIATDIAASNGVIHVIDGVLLPIQ
jgi:transforming growth factor-beta-induced protein